jgi:probable HAF family extracellular repeat protein
VLSWANPSSYAYDYRSTEIAPLAGYERSKALGINNGGEVVGRFYNVNAETGEALDLQAFIWDQAQGARPLSTLSGESSAWDINNHGMVSGYAYTSEGNRHAVLWDSSDNRIVDIGTLRNTSSGSSGPASRAYDLNDLLQVAGKADIPNDAGTFIPFHPFVYNELSGLRDLGTFNSSYPEWQNGYGIAYAVNNHGEAVGIAHDTSWTFVPFIYDDINGMQELTRDPAYTGAGDEWYAVTINDSGLIGGHVMAAANQSFPFYWPDKSGAPIRITMPAGFPYGEICGTNSSGQLVGIMWNSDQEGALEHAFVFDTTHGVRDLNALIDPASGWVLTLARDINDGGRIVGYGERNGLERGFVLNPTLPDELVCDFGPSYGLWHYDQEGIPDWSLLNPVDPDLMTVVDTNGDGRDELAAAFSGDGLSVYDPVNDWQRINAVHPEKMLAADIDGDGKDELVVAFNGYGLYAYDESGIWSTLPINEILPDGMIRYSGGIVCDFGAAYGLWSYNTSSRWVQLNTADADRMVAADTDGDGKDELAVSFPGWGLYLYEPETGIWQRINTVIPEGILPVDIDGDFKDELVISFPGYGLYLYEPETGIWQRVNRVVPENMIRLNNGIVCDFGADYGLWHYDQAADWTQLHKATPSSMVAVDLNDDGQEDLVAGFSGDGLLSYGNGSWAGLDSRVPDAILAIDFR